MFYAVTRSVKERKKKKINRTLKLFLEEKLIQGRKESDEGMEFREEEKVRKRKK